MIRQTLLIMMYSAAFAQPEKVVSTEVQQVTVFLQKAQVTRTATTKLLAGKSTLLITGLPARLDAESISVTGKGKFLLVGYSHRLNYLSEQIPPRQVKSWKDSIATLQQQVALEQSQKEILSKEEQLLLSNQRIGGSEQNLTVAELKAMADFFRTRMREIIEARLKQDQLIAKLNERIAKLQRQVASATQHSGRATSEVLINVEANDAGPAEFNLTYVVNDAGWIPQYDLRVTDASEKLKLNYRAKVFQQTGEAWPEVKLRLSTGNPTAGAIKPELSAWYIDFFRPMLSYKMAAQERAAAPPRLEDSLSEKYDASMATIADHVAVIESTLNVDFEIAVPYTVESGGKGTVVDVQNSNLATAYTYSVVPKLNTDVFLMANITDWHDLNLLPGEANIFMDGTYVGKTFIDPAAVNDTLKLSLGRDTRVVVKREKVKDLTSRQTWGGSQKEVYAFTINMRNGKSQPIKLTVQDQIPVAQHTQIEVSALKTDGAKLDTTTGRLEWVMELKPQQSKTISFSFEVKYPKDKTVNVGV